MLVVNQLSKSYDNKRGIQEIDFSIERGEIVGFLGPNGAGKTTTMRLITGYLHPSSGEVLVDGISLAKQPREVRRKIGYLPQTPPLYPDLTVSGYLKFIANLREIPRNQQATRIGDVLARLGFEGREKQLIRSLSQGYKQRLGLAQAIVHQPELLILDEPTSGLDPKQILEVRELIRELGKECTVLLSTHILQEVESVCNRVLIINDGKLVVDNQKTQLKQMSSTLRQGFECYCTVKGDQAQVETLLRALEGVQEMMEIVRPTTSVNDELVRFKIVASHDIREALFNTLAQHQLPLFELTVPTVTLEDIFIQATAGEGSNHE